VKRLLLVFMTLALSAAGCGGVKSGSADSDHTDGPDGGGMHGDGTDGGGTDGDGPDGGGTDGDGPDGGAPGRCVLGTSQLGNCTL